MNEDFQKCLTDFYVSTANNSLTEAFLNNEGRLPISFYFELTPRFLERCKKETGDETLNTFLIRNKMKIQYDINRYIRKKIEYMINEGFIRVDCDREVFVILSPEEQIEILNKI